MTDERTAWQELLHSDGWQLFTQYVASKYGAGALLNASNAQMKQAGFDTAAFGLVMRIMHAQAEVASELVKYPLFRIDALDRSAKSKEHRESQVPEARRRS